jgi:hypothetical protein
MPRKAKKKVHSMPKLGFWDKLLYRVLMIVGYGGSVVCVFAPMVQRRLLADANPDVLACDMEVEEILFGFCLALWLLAVGMIVTLKLYKPRIPVFGRSDIRYGPPAYPRIYPLLMRNKPVHWESQAAVRKRRRNHRILAGILIVTLLFSAAVFPLSLNSRYELLRDGTVMAYDNQNRSTHYDLEDLESVRLFVNRSGTRHRRWYPSFELRFKDGTRCNFNVRAFADDWIPAFQIAQGLKAYYGELLVIHGTEKLEKVTLTQSMTAMESRLLYELFEMSMPS